MLISIGRAQKMQSQKPRKSMENTAILSNAEVADESVNDTYLDAWHNMPPHRPSILSTFLGKITRRISIHKWRWRTADKRGGDEVSLVLDELSECVPSNLSVEDSVIAGELSAQINRFLGTLAPTERQVLLCRYWYLDPIDKISTDFCFSNSKVKSMLHRTRAKLRAYLEKEGVL